MSRPERTRVYQNHHLDSTRWDAVELRTDDVIISTSYKAGTTFVQTIVGNLIYQDRKPPEPLLAVSPWIDFRANPLDEIVNGIAQLRSRRFLKSHLPLDGLRYDDRVKYIMVGRDPRDVFMSLWNHYSNHTDQHYADVNDTPGRVGDPVPRCPDDIHELWRGWITRGWFDWERDGYPYWSHLHHCATWWEHRSQPNIKLVHYSDLLADLEGQMREIAGYLEIDVDESAWPRLVDACSFETVKRDPSKILDDMSVFFVGGSQTFIHKGTNGRWRDVLTADELAQYDAAMKAVLPPDAAAWLESGWLGR